jgi:hypothetical protein
MAVLVGRVPVNLANFSFLLTLSFQLEIRVVAVAAA